MNPGDDGAEHIRISRSGVEDLHAMLKKHGDWMPLGSADEQKPAADGTVEAWGRSAKNPVKGWYGLRRPAWPLRDVHAAAARGARPRGGRAQREEPDAGEVAMPFKSKAQRRKFAELLVNGKITDQTYEEWNRSTGKKELPQRVKPKAGARTTTKKRTTAKKRTSAKKTTTSRTKTKTRKQ